jgi:hypothetical protein
LIMVRKYSQRGLDRNYIRLSKQEGYELVGITRDDIYNKTTSN